MAIDGKGRPTKAQRAEKAAAKQEAELYRTLTNHIAKYDREFKKWHGRTEKILKRYRDEFRDGSSYDKEARFNILWSNVQTLRPAVFGRLPQPDVSRRFKDQDPIGRVGGMILERCLEYDIEHYPDYRATLKATVDDRLLGGRGSAWARYEPHILAKKQDLPEDGVEVTEDVDEPDEELEYECAPTDYVHWKDFGHNVARTWEEVFLVWRMVYLTRDACIERFGEDVGSKIPLDSRPETDSEKTAETEDSRALLYEIWDKSKMCAYWLNKSLGQIVDTRDDPLKLEGFFPCPQPLYATITNESLVPVPDFTLYQDQANELDVLCDRIDGLIKALQVKGVYNAEFAELQRLFTEGSNGTMIPIKNFAAFAEKNGLSGAIDLVDLQPIAKALEVAYQAFEHVKQQIYEISGISDILRGATDPNETLGAQQMKGQFASGRLGEMKQSVALFATNLLRIKAQIIVTKFDPQTIMKMACVDQFNQTDQQLVPQAMQLLLGERAVNPDADSESPVRAFRIEIAADSLVQMDEMQEKKERMEMLTAVGTMFQKALPMVQQSPEMGPMVLELIKFGVTAFKVGKSVEGMIDETMDKIKKGIEQRASQPPPPNPEMVKVQGAQQIAQQKLQGEQASAQQDGQLRMQEIQAEAAARQHEIQMEAQLEAHRNMLESQRAAQQAQMDSFLKQLEIRENSRTKIEVAEIGAKATLDSAQVSAANAATTTQ